MRARSIWLGCLLVTACASATRPVETGERSCGGPIRPEDQPARSPAERVQAARDYLARCGLEETIELTKVLVSYRTVSARGLAKDNPAFGQLSAYLRELAQDSGLSFEAFGQDDVWEIGLGTGTRELGFVMHADVVPVSAIDQPAPADDAIPEGWTRPPFVAQVDHGRLYGRGTEDDKAPIAAVLVLLRTLARFGIEPKGRILAILGTGEESNWDGMVGYAQTSTHPTHVISIDANYPVVVAESGFVIWKLELPTKHVVYDEPKNKPVAIFANAGQFLTQVPGEASLQLLPPKHMPPEELAKMVEAMAWEEVQRREPPFDAKVRVGGPRVVLTTRGQAVHSSTAHEGHNALWLLAAVAARLDLEPNAISRMLSLIATDFDGDHFGSKLGLAYEHPLMGKLLVIPTLLRTEDDKVSLSVNMRRPAGRSKAEFEASLDAALERSRRVAGEDLVSPERYVGEPALADTAGILVPTLLDIYRETLGDSTAQPVSIRGGTYARLFPGAVSFGPALPDRPYTGHGPDEHIELDVLQKMISMSFESLVRLLDLSSDASNRP